MQIHSSNDNPLPAELQTAAAAEAEEHREATVKDAKCKFSELEVSLQKAKQDMAPRVAGAGPGHRDRDLQEGAGWRREEVGVGITLQDACKEETVAHLSPQPPFTVCLMSHHLCHRSKSHRDPKSEGLTLSKALSSLYGPKRLTKSKVPNALRFSPQMEDLA